MVFCSFGRNATYKEFMFGLESFFYETTSQLFPKPQPSALGIIPRSKIKSYLRPHSNGLRHLRPSGILRRSSGRLRRG